MDDFARAQQLAVDAADQRTPPVHQAELRHLAQTHAILALAAAVDRLVLQMRKAAGT